MNATLRKLSGAAALAAVLCAPSAHAFNITSEVANGNGLSTGFSDPTLLAVDVAFLNSVPVSVTGTLEQADVGGSIAFNSVLTNTFGNFGRVLLSLTPGATFVLGSVEDINGGTPAAALTGGGSGAEVVPAGGVDEIYLGDVFTNGLTDWRIQFAGLDIGDSFTLSISSVPEPASLALVLGGIALLGVARRRAA